MSKNNHHVLSAWNEIFPILKNKYPNIPNDYTGALKALDFKDWELLQNWMYVRWRQIAFNAGVPINELDVHSETDRRMKMSELIQNYSHPFPKLEALAA
jgi:hypothetical protein